MKSITCKTPLLNLEGVSSYKFALPARNARSKTNDKAQSELLMEMLAAKSTGPFRG